MCECTMRAELTAASHMSYGDLFQEGSKLCLMMSETCIMPFIEKARIAGGTLRGCGECSDRADGRELRAVQKS